MIKTRGGFLISQIKQVQGRVFEKILAGSGIDEFNGAQGRILYVLWQEDSLPIVEISRRTGLAKTTLTSMLDRLEKSGFLTRTPSKGDRRQFIIQLTQKAWDLSLQYNKVSDEMGELFYAGFTNDEIEGFEYMLNRILKNLEKV